ncbi:MAG: N-6 DNA methylase, partial [Planctomycetaceae bacterium]|nr:N-6 DNA methylase [Planctomycetaceae bacterium]
MPRDVSNPDRQQGRYYTPPVLVEAMLRFALDPLLQSVSGPLRILDPACGEGAFLLAVADHLESWHVQQHDSGVAPSPSQLLGVDVDRSALRTLQLHNATNIQLHWGDALTGRGFEDPDLSACLHSAGAELTPALDWRETFPDVARDGGFDLIIGNPPYRRERASKTFLDCLKESPLGKRWYQARLDLWAYFLHRGLDLLRQGGRLAFVLPSYWTASTAAARLIERLRTETTILDVVQLGRARVFPDVEGWHLILHLIKGKESQPCRVWDLTCSGENWSRDVARLNPQWIAEESNPDGDHVRP